MDGEQQLAEFEKSHQPSLLGVTVRNDHVEGETPEPDQLEGEAEGDSITGSESASAVTSSRSRSRSRAGTNNVFKKSSSLWNQLDSSLADLQFEGALLNDDEGVLDDVLDDEGHLKEDALQITEQEKLSHDDEIPTVEHATTSIPSEVDEHKLEIFGGDAEKFIAPASGMQSSFALASPSITKSMDMEQNFELYKSEEVPSLQDVIQKVNAGELNSVGVDSSTKTESIEEKKSSSSPLKQVNVKDPQIPDFAIENDSEFVAPASAREGSSSRYLSTSRQRDFSPSPLKNSTGLSKPHLARGDSYHGGLGSDDYSDSASSVQDTSFERKPRHEPGSSRQITNPSSLSYLRSISRSRSRIANDRNALGLDKGTDEQELKQEGALLGDPYDQNSALEDAYTRALNITEAKTISPLSKEVETHLSGITEDADEEEEEAADEDTAKEKEIDTAEEPKKEEPDTENVETKETIAGAVTEETPEEAAVEETEVDTATKELEPKVKSEEANADIETEEVKKIEVEDKESEPEVESKKDESEVNTTEALEPEVNSKDAKKADDLPKEDVEVESEKEDKSTFNVEEKPEVAEKEESSEVEASQEKEVVESSSKDDEESETAKEEIKEDGQEVLNESDEEPVTEKAEEPVAEKTKDIPSVPVTKEIEKDDTDDLDFDIPELKKDTKPAGHVAADGSVYVPKESKMTFEDEPVYIYTSLAGGFQIMSRTNRLITILTANKIAYECRDLGTDEEAKKVWRRYSSGKTLPGIVRGKDDYIGNWQDIEDANENYAVRSLIYETF